MVHYKQLLLGKGNSSLRLGILLANGAAEVIYNVVFKQFNIKRSLGINELGILEHCHSVALREQMIVEACENVFLVNIKVTVFAAFSLSAGVG